MADYLSYPPHTMAPLYRGPREFDLSESTTRDLQLGDLIELVGLATFSAIELDYGHHDNGLPAFREAIGARWGVPAGQILTTHGANFALYLIASTLAAPNSHAIITAPFFQQAYNTLQAHRWEISTVQNQFDDGYTLNVAGIVAALKPKTRLVSIATPQNPSGILIPRQMIADLLNQMRQLAPDAYLLVDETYLEATYDPISPVPTVATLSERVLTCCSVSKAYGAPGLRAGWLTASDENLYAAMTAASGNILITNSVLSEQLATILLTCGAPVLNRQRGHLRAALDIVRAWQATEATRLDWNEPDAGGLCCMRIRADFLADAQLTAFWEALAELDTLVRPGLLFGSDQRHFRLGFGHIPYDMLEQGLSNISKALDYVTAG